jgi:hypothetical protein
MSTARASRTDLYHGLFSWEQPVAGPPLVARRSDAPATIPDPQSGRLLRIATVDAGSPAICPACETAGAGGFVSFVQDLRLAYACPSCQELVWLPGA